MLHTWHIYIYMHVCMVSHVRLYNSMDYSPPDSCVCGIFQTRILEWVAI